jgi:ribosomal-protein-alanine N-acetyltransferase
MKILTAGPSVAPILAAIHREAFDPGWSETNIRELVSSPGAFALVAEDEGAPLAFVIARTAVDEAEILTLATLPAARRRGLARALMSRAADLARERGARRLLLEVGEDNPAARALYDTLGFETVGRRRGYYARPGGGEDARVLACYL